MIHDIASFLTSLKTVPAEPGENQHLEEEKLSLHESLFPNFIHKMSIVSTMSVTRHLERSYRITSLLKMRKQSET